ncbi:MAG: hypothetical protein KZY74_13765, partial [Paenibacillaceae bacterium]|nr:hypothetical protein [Paenibacillaceae bacterium]
RSDAKVQAKFDKSPLHLDSSPNQMHFCSSVVKYEGLAKYQLHFYSWLARKRRPLNAKKGSSPKVVDQFAEMLHFVQDLDVKRACGGEMLHFLQHFHPQIVLQGRSVAFCAAF